jgi:hydroxymethylbilane synthase
MALKIRIGSRPSKLALAQAAIVSARLRAVISDIEIEIVEIRTSGDKMTTASLAQVGGKGLFVKELEQALDAGQIDLAVHSMKDLPAILPDGFQIASVPDRENTADVLVTRDGATLAMLVPGARLGTTSMRRRFQALTINPKLEVAALRGNVDSRLKKVADCEMDAIIIAMAGLKRLGRIDEVRFVELDEQDFIPAGAQGALAIETLRARRPGGSGEIEHALAQINDPRAFYETAAERAFLAAIGASCTTPVGVRAIANDSGQLTMRAILFGIDGARAISESSETPIDVDLAPSAAEMAGRELGERILARGGAALIAGE